MTAFSSSDVDSAADFVAEGCGRRLMGQRRFVRRCCQWAAEDWPGPDADTLAVLLRRRTRDEYGSVLAAILVPMLVNLIASLIVDWWKRRHQSELQRFG